MSTNNPYEKVQNQAVFTMPKEELTLMLYEGALKYCNQAILALEKKDYVKTGEHIVKVENIIREFQLTLNRDYEISKSLDAIYDYIHRRLVDANISKEMAILEEVRELLRDLRDTWKEAIAISRAQNPPQAANK
jgi:flagellar protein FliS